MIGIAIDVTRPPPLRGAARAPRLPRSAHRPAEPGHGRGAARARARARRARPVARSGRCTSTSTSSSSSTTRSGTRPATRCSSRSPSGSAPSRATATCSPASAATSSCSSARASATPLRPPRPAGSSLRSTRRWSSTARSSRSAPRSASRSGRATATRRTSCSSTPMPPCTRPSAPAATHTRSTRTTRATTRRRLTLNARLRRALDEEQFVLHYQPVHELAGGAIRGVEALLRWQDPDERPGAARLTSCPHAEESGLIVRIGEWVLETACRQAAEWEAAGLMPRMAFNASPRELRDDRYVDRVAAALERHGLAPGQLLIEVSESAMHEFDRAHDVIAGAATSSAWCSRSTTSARSTRRSRACARCRCRCSRSTARS